MKGAFFLYKLLLYFDLVFVKQLMEHCDISCFVHLRYIYPTLTPVRLKWLLIMFYYVELNFFLNILVSKVTGTGNVILRNKIKISANNHITISSTD